ncbi:hypothetical protein [Melittangium boletus]|uniref:hypothetical protein n=1 Tax=Melittangium boletus TaxID=83453 RepID=UPI003DA3D5CB
MRRFLSSLLLVLWVLTPWEARAADVLTRVKKWFSDLGEPTPPPEEEEEDLGARNTFTVNPLALKYAQLGMEYERALGSRLSVYLAPEFSYGQTSSTWALGLAGTVGTRLFVLGTAPSGVFFGPELSVNYQVRFADHVRTKGLGLGLGGSVGWTLVLFDRITLSAGFSAQYRSIPDLDSPEEGALRVQIVPTPRLAFGVAF